MKTKNTTIFSNLAQKRLPLFVVLFAIIGVITLIRSFAATPPVPTFKLFAPGWKALGLSDTNTIDTVATRFPKVFGFPPPDQDSYSPADIHRSSFNGKPAEDFVYTLGPYVTAQYVPCNLIPPGGSTAGCGIKSGTNSGQLDPSAIAKGVTGKALYPYDFTNNYLINPASEAWKSFVSADAARVMKFNGDANNVYDGMLSDSMGTAPLNGYLVSSDPADVTKAKKGMKPVDPVRGGDYITGNWTTDQKVMLAAKKQGIESVAPGKKLIFNGLANGARYWGVDSPIGLFNLNPDIAGVMAERIFRDPADPIDIYQSGADWLLDVRMIEDVQAHKIAGYWWSKCWSHPGDKTDLNANTCKNDPPEKVTQLRRFLMGSFLLGAGPNSFFNFELNKYDRNAAEWSDDYYKATLIGSAGKNVRVPSDTIYHDQIYSRVFSKGLVLVNSKSDVGGQPGSGTLTFDLTGNYKDIGDVDGSALRTGIVNVPAHSALILIKQ